jgi:hypothetical protein
MGYLGLRIPSQMVMMTVCGVLQSIGSLKTRQ